jgi:H2-forming N(5),N(10)-methenyltetrahydromethanopterin dehydrogenase-like protein
MKVVVWGFGDQRFFTEILNVPSLFGGNPPFGGAAAAAEFAKAGYETVLIDEHISDIPPEYLDSVKASGVVATDDLSAAEGATVAVLFTPFERGETFEAAKKLIPYLDGEAVFATTGNIPPLTFKAFIERDLLREGKRNIGISTLHPAAIPGTPQHKQYLIATNELLREPIATDEQIGRLKKLAEDTGKKAYLLPAELIGAIGDGSVGITASVLLGVLEFDKVAKDILHIRKQQMEFQTVQSLTTVANIVAKYGIEGLVKLLNLDAVRDSLKSMFFSSQEQPVTANAMRFLQEFDQEVKQMVGESAEEKMEPAYLSVPTSAMLDYIFNILGENMLKNLLRDAERKFYDEIEERNNQTKGVG